METIVKSDVKNHALRLRVEKNGDKRETAEGVAKVLNRSSRRRFILLLVNILVALYVGPPAQRR